MLNETKNGWYTLPSGKKVRKRPNNIQRIVMHNLQEYPRALSSYTREIYNQFLSEQPWTHFMSLTFRDHNYKDGKKPPSYNHVKEAVERIENYTGWDQAFVVLEQGKMPHNDQASETPLEVSVAGRWHLHGLARFKEQKDVSFFSAQWEWMNGFVDIQEIKSVEATSKYVTKYVTKDGLLFQDRFVRMWFLGVSPWNDRGVPTSIGAPPRGI